MRSWMKHVIHFLRGRRQLFRPGSLQTTNIAAGAKSPRSLAGNLSVMAAPISLRWARAMRVLKVMAWTRPSRTS